MLSLENVTPEEWEFAERYLKPASDGTKIKKTNWKRKYINPTTGVEVKLKHSFIKIEDNIYTMASGEYLGKGAFGKVKLVKNKDNKLFAIKISREINWDEAKISRDLGIEKARPIQIIGSFKNYHLMEYLGTSLSDFLSENNLNGSQRLDLALQCVVQVDNFHKGYSAISKRKRIHRDIKESNFVIKEGKITLIDFGIATNIKDSNEIFYGQYCGTPGYIAPEVEQYQTSVKSDIYSLGVVLEHVNKGNKNVAYLYTLMQSENPQLRPDLNLVKIFLLVELNNSDEVFYNELNLTAGQAKAVTVAMLCSKSVKLYEESLINNIKNNPLLCQVLTICYDYLKDKDLFSYHGKKATEKFVSNLLTNPALRTEEKIKAEIDNYLFGKGEYGTWYGGASSHKEGSRISYMQKGGLFALKGHDDKKQSSERSADELKEPYLDVKPDN
ncbi:Serine/threonine-protein kinase A [Legionella busanensis]|uniref:Serine/threonine-protein kinase A n=1 Tax=Legionella busanensis TaxID=190655 RepID=A0A378KB26_9GAMM|nr:protein kinase [Legionella busanensis]STX81383.1 Serine/threonine-protein kinase A [Legionella busanensis]